MSDDRFDVLAHHAVDFWLCGEDLPRPENRVTLDGDGRPPRDRREEQRRGPEAAATCPADLARRPGDTGETPVALLHLHARRHADRRDGTSGGHGALGTDPASSAIDIDCRAHELDNLYVVDTSFVPSIGAVNPSLTVMANALGVGDHVFERLE